MWYDYGAADRGERELRELCERCTEISAPVGTQTRYRAEAYRGLGEILIDRGETTEATTALDASLRTALNGNHPRHVVNALNSLAWVAMTRDAYHEAECHPRAALDWAAGLDPCGPVSDTLYYRARVARAQGEPETAAERLTDVIDLDRELGNRRNQSSSEKLAGDIAAERGETLEARDHYRRSLTLKREIRDRSGEAVVLLQLGRLATRDEQYATADEMLEESLLIGRTMEMQPHVADVHDAFGRLALARNEFSEAGEHFETCRALRDEIDDRRGAATATLGLGDAARASGDTPSARCRYRDALATFCELDAVSNGCEALVSLVSTCRAVADEQTAQSWRELGVEWSRVTDDGPSVDEFERRLIETE
jgi:tetratricopeptide (TPR) repeat protein